MKKTLLLLASAALLLVGCAKEKFAEPNDGGLTSVTFSARVDGGVATKASADLDGKGANVNRCIMEIYFQDQLYKRMEAAMSGTPATATFSNVPVVAGKQYEILFWADNVDVVNTEEGLAPDKYYTTKTEENNVGLKAVAIKQAAFLAALEAGDNDELDAFYGAKKYTVPQAGGSFSITLHRPFAQMNVITTDVASGKTVISADLLPETVTVSYTAATTFNVADSLASGSTTYTYTAPVYGDKTDWSAVKTRGEFTLSMDYILAAKEKSMVDVSFQTSTGMSHSLTSLPYQRNYRTNVKGDLLTTGGTWTATIDTTWLSPDIVKVVEVADIKSANEIIEQYAQTTDNLEVKFVGVPNDSGQPSGNPESQFRAILTSPLKQGANLGIEVMTSTNTLYVGDYIYEYKVTGETVDEYIDNTAKPATVNINVPANSGIQTLIINAPSKTVYVNGHRVDGVGEITNIDAITSMNTLIIEPGQKVGKLTMRQGGLEIHGTVGEAIVPSEHGSISVRDCENLDETKVYDVLKHHIADGYVGVKDRTTVGKWDIVPIVCKIGEIGYGSLADAVAAVPTNGSETTITMVNDFATTEKVTIAAAKNVVLELNGKKISYTADACGTFIENRGQLKVQDSGSNGIITAEFSAPNWSAGCYTINNAGTYEQASKLVIESGTVENTSPAGLAWPVSNGIWGTYADLVINGGTIHSVNYVPVREYLQYGGRKTIVINDGKLISDNSRAIAIQLNDATVADQGSYVEINGGEFSCNGSGILYVDLHAANLNTTGFTMTVNGGKFKNANADAPVLVYDNESNDQSSAVLLSNVLKGGVYSKKPADEIVADKYIVTENADADYPWKVVISPDAVTVAKIGTTEYYSLSDALTAAKEGEAVYIIPAQLEETVSASNDNNIQLILDGKAIVGDIAFGGKGTLIVRAEELNKDYYSYSKAYEVDAPTIPAQGVGGIMGKISATDNATVMLRENLYSGPFEGNVELRGGFYSSGLGLDNIKAQTPSGIGLVVDQVQNVQGYDMYYVPEVPESYLVHFPNVAELMTAYIGGQLSDEQINQITFGYGLGERIMLPWWLSVDGGDNSLVPTGDNYFPDDVYAFFTNLRDGEYDNPKYAYQDWLCDYVISYSEPIKKDYQSGIWGYYSNMSIGCWLPSSVTQAPFAMLSAVNMKRFYSQMLSDVGMFLCGPVNLNPEDTGIVITVNLNIYPDSETNTCITTNKVVYTIPAISE